MQGGCPSRQSCSFPLDMLTNCNFLSCSISPLILLTRPLFLLVSHIYIWTLQQLSEILIGEKEGKGGIGDRRIFIQGQELFLTAASMERHIPSLSLCLSELEPFLSLLSPWIFAPPCPPRFVCHNIVSMSLPQYPNPPEIRLL